MWVFESGVPCIWNEILNRRCSHASLSITPGNCYSSATDRTMLEAFCFPAVRASVRDHILVVCLHDILQTVCGNFTKFTTSVHFGT